MAGDMEPLVHVLAPAQPCPAPPRSRLCAKERSTISARSLKASLATPDNSRVRLLVTARRAAPSPCQRAKPFCLGSEIRASRGRRRAPLRPTVSDSPCRSHIRPGLRPSVPRPPPRDSPWPPPASSPASSCRPRRPGVARRPPPRRCPDPPRARACRPDGSCRPSSWRSWPRGRSSRPSPGSRASCPCLARRARSSAVGVSMRGQARQHPPPSALRTMLRSAALARGIDPDALALDQTRLGDQSQNPVEDRRVDLMGQRARVRDSQEWSGTRSRLSSRRNVATGNPSSAIPARAQSRCPRSSPPGACGNSAPAAPKAPPAWPPDRPPRQSRRNRPRSDRLQTVVKHMTRERGISAQHHRPPDDPSAVSSSANPPVKSERQRIRPGRLCPVPTSSTGC